MTGPKLNEGATVAGERAGTKATAKYVRSSASKARAVLDLIRGLDVRRADQVLQFTERGIARDVRKVLASAVANAVANDGQDAEELFVLACFADEGPTLRRFRPRARGRATRIRKRTCHITVVVARMSDDRIALIQARETGATGRGRPTTSAASRRARVERSRQRAAAAAGTAAADAATADAEPPESEDAVDTTEELAEDIEELAEDEVEAAESVEDVAATETAAHAGSALPLEDGSAPEGFEIKGNENSMLYHTPESRYYDITQADVYFDTVESAEAAGFSAPASSTPTDEEGS
jgi:large subunit ribosomal protein L22